MQKNLCSLTVFFEDPSGWASSSGRTAPAWKPARSPLARNPGTGRSTPLCWKTGGSSGSAPGSRMTARARKNGTRSGCGGLPGANSKGAGLPQRHRRPSSFSGNRQSRNKNRRCKRNGKPSGSAGSGKDSKRKRKNTAEHKETWRPPVGLHVFVGAGKRISRCGGAAPRSVCRGCGCRQSCCAVPPGRAAWR